MTEYQAPAGKWQNFFAVMQSAQVGLAYFLGSQKELGSRLLNGERMSGASLNDLDLEVVRLEHPLDYREGQKLR